jgi:hypothetical protein
MRSICDLLIAGMSSPSLEPAVSDSKQRSHHAQFQFETKTAHLNVIFFVNFDSRPNVTSRTFFPANSRGLADFEFAKRGD